MKGLSPFDETKITAKNVITNNATNILKHYLIINYIGKKMIKTYSASRFIHYFANGHQCRKKYIFPLLLSLNLLRLTGTA